ncbi:MAG: hypothetical protein KAT14_07965 [Candidatus Marinimicrobia bacterium]|nr:hypothetical protein [Candidatus Neomarinimicrobiota bacterium]
MKTVFKLWDKILISALGLLGISCNIFDPPAPEYGIEPLYGVVASTYIVPENNYDQNGIDNDFVHTQDSTLISYSNKTNITEKE